MATVEPPKADWTVLPMGPRAQELFRNVFLPHYQQLVKEVENTPLVVLVWGPGPGAGELYAKRCQIRDQLRGAGIAAVFSEEVDAANPVPGTSARARELLQAVAADFIVVLHGSAGSIAETHDFSTFLHDIGSKMLVFIDERNVDGYSYTGALRELRVLYNNVETFRYPEDIQACHLTRGVMERVHVLRHAKWRYHLR